MQKVSNEKKDDDEEEDDGKKTHSKPLVIPRSKNESKDEKKARKNAIKEDKRVRIERLIFTLTKFVA